MNIEKIARILHPSPHHRPFRKKNQIKIRPHPKNTPKTFTPRLRDRDRSIFQGNPTPIGNWHSAIGNPMDHTTPFATLTPANVPWLWPNRLPLAQISLLASRPGEGKGLLTADIAARISTGSPWPDGSPCPRLRHLHPSRRRSRPDHPPASSPKGRILSNVHILSVVHDIAKMTATPDLLFNVDNLNPLDNALQSLPDCKLVIFDPISAFFPGFDIRQDFIVRQSLASLIHLAQRHGPAILLVHHLRSRGSGLADQRLLGGQALASVSRNIWHLLRDPQHKSRRLFLAGKSNLSPESPGLAFNLTPANTTTPALTWEPTPLEMNADEALATLSPQNHGPPPIERQAAEIWLKTILAEGPTSALEIRMQCDNAGFSYKTVQRAALQLNVQKERGILLGEWIWKLPNE